MVIGLYYKGHTPSSSVGRASLSLARDSGIAGSIPELDKSGKVLPISAHLPKSEVRIQCLSFDNHWCITAVSRKLPRELVCRSVRRLKQPNDKKIIKA